VISDSPTSYLSLCTGVRTNDDGALEWGLAVRQQATRQQLKATLLLRRRRRRLGDAGDAARGFCFEPATN
jgi:hypothetical protein